MPSRSKKQHNFMEGIAHGMKPRKGKGPSKAVAQEFVAADKGTKLQNLPERSPPPKGAKSVRKALGI
jgi:hypothetical protein